MLRLRRLSLSSSELCISVSTSSFGRGESGAILALRLRDGTDDSGESVGVGREVPSGGNSGSVGSVEGGVGSREEIVVEIVERGGVS